MLEADMKLDEAVFVPLSFRCTVLERSLGFYIGDCLDPGCPNSNFNQNSNFCAGLQHSAVSAFSWPQDKPNIYIYIYFFFPMYRLNEAPNPTSTLTTRKKRKHCTRRSAAKQAKQSKKWGPRPATSTDGALSVSGYTTGNYCEACMNNFQM